MSNFTLEVTTTERERCRSPKSTSETIVQQLFTLFDADRSGAVSTEDLKSVLNAIGQNPTKAELQAMVAEFDCEGNGEIGFEEFSLLLSKCIQMSDDEYKERVAEAFEIMDMDRNGFIEPRELQELMKRLGQHLSDDDVERIMDEVDRSDGDRVSFAEFQELMMQNRIQLGF
ncbi:neo-calmodulin-like [Corticium candelabrum]|uniref:neo-calmodulin-like n=1 Tax=Corticium candelabrum TaxID=121492 RepID=UPI002E25BED9|nr:neo-calmodulin-like [Corticium candelabrum]